MKILYTTAIALLISLSSYAQECVDFSKVSFPFWGGIEGVVLYDQGGIVLKGGSSFDPVLISDNDMSFSGDLHIDVSSSDCNDQTLEFSTNGQYIVVADDTVDLFEPILMFPIVKTDYEINYNTETFLYSVSGDFEEVIIGESTNMVDHICLTNNCIDLGSNEVSDVSFTIFPNPATSLLNIDADFESLEIVNLLGETVIQSNTQSKSIDVSGLATGAYFVKVNNNGQSSVSRFIKK